VMSAGNQGDIKVRIYDELPPSRDAVANIVSKPNKNATRNS
jgi:hypothetical protein